MKTVFVLGFLIYAGTSMSQWRFKNNTEYGYICARYNEKDLSDQNLKGQVKKLVVLGSKQQDSLIYKYSETGRLITFQHFNSVDPTRFQRHRYGYRNDSLMGIEILYGSLEARNRRELKRFKNGFLSFHEVYHKPKEDDNISKTSIKYQYSDNNNEVKIKYNYKGNTDGWSLPRNGKLTFKFDETGRLSKERIWTDYGESSSGANRYLFYNSDSNLPNNILFRSDCAGSNSCLHTETNITRDENGKVVLEKLEDYTIRNATWSYSYAKGFKYNENGDLLAYRSNDNEAGRLIDDIMRMSQQQTQKTIEDQIVESQGLIPFLLDQFHYEYDETGNWVKKFRITEAGHQLLLERKIVYY